MSNIQSGDMAYRNQGEFIYDVYVRTPDGLAALCHAVFNSGARVYLYEQEIQLERILFGTAIRFRHPIKVRVKMDSSDSQDFQDAQLLRDNLTKKFKVDVVRGVV